MKRAIYRGWLILAGKGVGRSRKSDYKHKLKSIFGQPGWLFEDNDRTLIHNLSFDSPIEVIFPEETTEEEKSIGLHKYGCVIRSEYFSWGSRSECLHKQLCNEVLHMITWQKDAYFIVNGKFIPVRKKRLLKWKKRR